MSLLIAVWVAFSIAEVLYPRDMFWCLLSRWKIVRLQRKHEEWHHVCIKLREIRKIMISGKTKKSCCEFQRNTSKHLFNKKKNTKQPKVIQKTDLPFEKPTKKLFKDLSFEKINKTPRPPGTPWWVPWLRKAGRERLLRRLACLWSVEAVENGCRVKSRNDPQSLLEPKVSARLQEGLSFWDAKVAISFKSKVVFCLYLFLYFLSWVSWISSGFNGAPWYLQSSKGRFNIVCTTSYRLLREK